MPHVLRSLSCAVLYPMVTTLGIRAYLYGYKDMCVIRMALYLILPALLLISTDVLCKLIHMYRVGLKIVAKEKKDWSVCWNGVIERVIRNLIDRRSGLQ